MDYIGIDLHKTSSQVCILTADGELIERRIKTDRESFDKLLAGKPPARILVEASTDAVSGALATSKPSATRSSSLTQLRAHVRHS